MAKKYEEFSVGDRAEFRRHVDSEDIRKFVELTGDDNPLHTDRHYAAGTPFKDIVVHGMLGASFISTIIGKYLPGEGALWVSQNFQFLLPTRLGDDLLISAEVLRKHPVQRLLDLKVEIKNQHGQVVLGGEGVVRMLETVASPDATPLTRPEHKVVLVTGASRGIGAAIARLLASQGWHVAVNFREDQVGAESVCEAIRQQKGIAFPFKADVTDPAAVRRMVALVRTTLGDVQALVNNATGRILPREFSALEWPDFQQHLDVQVRGAFHCIQAVLEGFLKSKQGVVINIGSSAVDQPPPKWSAYSTAKGALGALTKSLAVEFGPKGIRFNLVSPGMTETALIADIPERARLVTAMQTPLRRLATPEDVAHAVAFLLSDGAAFISGETLRVCGGQFMI